MNKNRVGVSLERLYAILLLVSAGGGAFLKSWTAPNRALSTWDEAIYYTVAERVLDGRWLLPQFIGRDHQLAPVDPFLHKPPLVYWLHAAGMRLLGETPASARLVSALATVTIAVLVVALAYRLSGPLSATLSVAGLAVVPGLYGTHAGNNIATDPFILAFALGAIYAYVRVADSEGRASWMWAAVAGVAGGLAVLSKGPAVGPIALGCLPLVWVLRTRVTPRQTLLTVVAAVATAAPWFLVVGMLAGDQLLNQMLLSQTVARATGAMFIENPGTFGFMRYPYFRTAPEYIGLLWWATPVLLIGGLWRLRTSSEWRDVVLWAITLGVGLSVGLIYVVAGNHPWYWLPVVPMIVLGTASLAAHLLRLCIDVTVTSFALWSRSSW